MALPIKNLPLVESWDCHGCATCCRGSIIRLDEDDLKKLQEQAWDQHPEYRGTRVVVRDGWLTRRFRLAKRGDGSCVFLMPDGRCRIHAEHGPTAKPLVCRAFPLQLVPLGDFACLTVRRSCPSAAAARGAKVDKNRRDLRQITEVQAALLRPNRPPAIVPGCRRPWNDFFLVADALERIVRDPRYPLVRRLVHGLRFCDELERCRLGRLDSPRLGQLAAMLESSAADGAGDWFRDRRAPSRAAAAIFRQAALQYLCLHPRFRAQGTWRDRWRMARAGWAFARGKGRVPAVLAGVPETGLESLERPLGPLDEDTLRPIHGYYEASAVSKQYAILGRRGWSLVESFRAMALAYPVGLWMLRLAGGETRPTADQAIEAIGAIDRAQGEALLSGASHRRRLGRLASLDELPRLVAWYGR